MSIAIINASISGTMTVAGTSTLSGALTSGSTLNAQGITSTTLNLTNNLVQTVGSISTGTTGLLCNGNATITGNTLINSNCSVLGNLIISQNLVAGATTITNTSLGFISGLTSNAQTQINTGQTQANAIYGNVLVEQQQRPAIYANVISSQTQTNAIYGNVLVEQQQRPAIYANVISSQTQTNGVYGNVTTLQQKTTGISYISPNPSTTISGNLNITGNTYLNSNPLYIKSLGDNNHLLQYVGAPYDGVALQGNGGGKIGTVVKTDMINWTSSAGINTVNIGANTNLTGNVNILPYTSNTTLSTYTLNCNAVTCLGQIVAGGVGITTAKLQVTNNGTGILGLQCGSFQASTNANQTVTFPNSFSSGNNPLVFLQPVYASAVTGTAYVISTSLTNFVYRFFFDGSVNSESAVLMYWSAYQI